MLQTSDVVALLSHDQELPLFRLKLSAGYRHLQNCRNNPSGVCHMSEFRQIDTCVPFSYG